MKKIFSAIIILLSVGSLYAQKKSFSLSINGGIAAPTGNFSKGDYADETSGFAKTGGHFNVTGICHLNKNWGIGLLVGYSQFGFKNAQSLADGYKEDSGTDSTTLYAKGHNSTLSVLIGPSYFIPVSKQFSVQLRAMGGYVNTHLAGFQIFYEDMLDNSLTQDKSSGGTFGFQFGAGVKYDVTDKIALQFNADYFSSKPKLDITYENFVVNSGRRLNTYNEPISGVNATLGVAFELGK